MRADTKNYIHLQKLYKKQADDEKTAFKGYLKEVLGGEEGVVEDAMVDTFVKNVHQLKILKGKKWGALDKEKTLLGGLNLSPLLTQLASETDFAIVYSSRTVERA